MKVAPVTSSRDAAKKGAAKIDELVEANLAKQKLKPTRTRPITSSSAALIWTLLVSSPMFLNTKPTWPPGRSAQAREASRRPLELARLCQPHVQLLGSHSAGRGSPKQQYHGLCLSRLGQGPTAYQSTLRSMGLHDAHRGGKVWENPAVGYALRDDGMPLVAVDNTVRVF